MKQLTEEEAKQYVPCKQSRSLKRNEWETTAVYFTSVPCVDPHYKGFDDIKYYTNKLIIIY